VHFTREPIIETVITPRDGCKLIIRATKRVEQEDYCVDAIEVVSFGHSLFLRSLERPKAFLVPMGDYEILELKETRVVLKNANNERSIKIGGGRETPVRHQAKEAEEQPVVRLDIIPEPATQTDQAPDKKRDRRRSRRRRGPGSDLRQEITQNSEESSTIQPLELKGGEKDEDIAPSFISKLFPPPPTLIKETLSRYKPTEKEKLTIEENIVLENKTFEMPVVELEDSEKDSSTFQNLDE